jgi:Na+/alanine symporter
VLLTWKLVLEPFFGLAVQWGVKGIYSNEAGQAAAYAAAANVSHLLNKFNHSQFISIPY